MNGDWTRTSALLLLWAGAWGCVVVPAAVDSPPTAPAPILERVPVAPAPGHVWIPGYWAWTGARYVWVPGRYAVTPGPGYAWTPGYWAPSVRGHVWIGGHWRIR